MANLVENPFPVFKDLNGDPLEDGYIFIGSPGFSPLTNPLQAYWDAALTNPANDIRTKGGYPSYLGTPARLYTATNYSILVQDKRGAELYQNLNSVDYFNSASGSAISSVANIAALRGITPAGTNVQVSVGGSVTEGDGLMGPLYYWDSSSSAADNGVSVIKPTAVTGNGRWLWLNTNAPTETVNISASGVLSLDNIDKIFLVNSGLAVALTVPDGDFQGQRIQVANRGTGTVTISGTGIADNTGVPLEAILSWLGTQWGVVYTDAPSFTDITGRYRFESSVDSLTSVGTPLVLSMDLPEMCKLTSTTFALMDTVDDKLKAYSFNGSIFSLLGELTLPDLGAVDLARLSDTDIVWAGSGQDTLTVHRWNGTTWAQVGNGFGLGTFAGAVTALSATRVAVVNDPDNSLKMFDWDGTNFSQVGNTLVITKTGFVTIAALNGSTVVVGRDSTSGNLMYLLTYNFDGADWKLVNETEIGSGTASSPSLEAIASDLIVFCDEDSSSIQCYRRRGDWVPEGEKIIAGVTLGNPGVAVLTPDRIVYTSQFLGELRAYDLSYFDDDYPPGIS